MALGLKRRNRAALMAAVSAIAITLGSTRLSADAPAAPVAAGTTVRPAQTVDAVTPRTTIAAPSLTLNPIFVNAEKRDQKDRKSVV